MANDRTAEGEHPDYHKPHEGVTQGIPHEMTEADAAAYPTSDRLQSETAPAPAGGNAETPKHSHDPEN